jgi:hypothetical protein
LIKFIIGVTVGIWLGLTFPDQFIQIVRILD